MNKIAEEATRLAGEFAHVMGQPPDPDLSLMLVNEEAEELVEAYMEAWSDPTVETLEHLMKEAGDFAYVVGVLQNAKMAAKRSPRWGLENEAWPAIAGAIEARINLTNWGVLDDPLMYEIIWRIHQSNMSKVDDDGNPIRNADGKIMKGPNYEPPVLTDLAQDRIENFQMALLASAVATMEYIHEEEA